MFSPIYLRLEDNVPPPRSVKNEMLVFGLHSTSDDWLSNLSDKCEKMAAKSSKNEMLISGLHSTFGDRPSNPRDESCLKCKKLPPNCQKMKCSFLHYVQLLMIGRAIQVIKVAKNAKKKGKNVYGKIDMTKN